MSECWRTYNLDLINYQNKCKLIKGWDELFEKVKEHINSVTAMKLSPYYKVGTTLLLFYSDSSCLNLSIKLDIDLGFNNHVFT